MILIMHTKTHTHAHIHTCPDRVANGKYKQTDAEFALQTKNKDDGGEVVDDENDDDDDKDKVRGCAGWMNADTTHSNQRLNVICK